MYFLDTEMTLVVFIITVVEIVMLILQVKYYLQRPSDKSRLWYLILLYFLIQYNIASGLFPDPNLGINILVQNILAYASGTMMSMYFCIYFYLAYELKHLRFFALYGMVFFILIPFLVIFIAVYYITEDLELAREWLVIIPFIYGIGWVYNVTKSFRLKYRTLSDGREKKWLREQMIGVYLALFFWMALSPTVYYGGGQILEQGLTNTGFLVMSFLYVRVQILKSQAEYKTMIAREERLNNMELELKEKEQKLTENAIKIERIDDFLEKFRTAMSNVDFKDREVFSPVLSFVKNDWDIKSEMKYFEKHFEAVYSDFFTELETNFPDLNKNEKKYLTFMKIGLSNKESSALLGLTMESLKSYRYRMKKKLYLDKNTTLEEFIETL